MSCEFLGVTGYDKYSDPEVLVQLLYKMIKEHVIFVNEEVTGMLAGMIFPFLFGTVKTATEIGWWVSPEDRNKKLGKALLDAFEAWAKEQGCTIITMICLDTEVGKFYEKNGYSLKELTYSKEIV